MTQTVELPGLGKRVKPARFWAWVDKSAEGGCWLWVGRMYRAGGRVSSTYGRYRDLRAHRVAYELVVGRIPDGFEIDHLCRVQWCVNPAHLEAVTPEENRRRRFLAQTHCKRDHEFTPGNTYMTPGGSRQCRACCRIRSRAAHLRKAARR